jgi:hypothetical protein
MSESGHSRRSRFGRESVCPPISDMSGGWQIRRDVPIPDSYSAASRTLRRSRFVMQAIDACWWRCRCRPDEVARIAEPVGKEGRLHHAAQAGAQPPKGTIDIAIVLPFEVLQDFLPRPGRAADHAQSSLWRDDWRSSCIACGWMEPSFAGAEKNLPRHDWERPMVVRIAAARMFARWAPRACSATLCGFGA